MISEAADVVIVGAGPGGCAAAITLRRAGLEVVLVDRATFPRDKICGDGLTSMALRALRSLGFDGSDLPSWKVVEKFSIRSPYGRWIHLELPANPLPRAAVARRHELDSALVELTRAAGALVLSGHKVDRAAQDESGVEVHGDGFSVRASWLIGADGMWSPTRKMLRAQHPPDYRGEWHAFRQYFTGVEGRAAEELVVWFEADLLPGYAWSFPLGDGAANVGFGIDRGRRHSIQDMAWLWPELLARPHLRQILGPNAQPEGPHKAWPIPCQADQSPLTLGRALWIGDAAAMADQMSGEGIGQALESGIWAAESIVEASAGGPGVVAAHYQRRVAADLLPDHRMARLLSEKALCHRKGVEFPLWLVDQTRWSRTHFARWLWEDYPRGVITTPRRWNQMRSPG